MEINYLTRKLITVKYTVIVGFVLFILSSGNFSVAETPTGSRFNTEHTEAIRLARNGQYDPSLQILKSLRERYPHNKTFLHDMVLISGWAGKDQQALSFLPELNVADAPEGVLEVLAKAARNESRFEEAEGFYQAILYRNPAHKQAQLGLAFTRADAGYPERSIELFQQLLRKFPDNIEVLSGYAYVLRIMDDPVQSAAIYHRIVKLEPENLEAKRNLILALHEMGAPHLAASEMLKSPDLLTVDQRDQILADRAAFQVRWGETVPLDDGKPYADTDKSMQYFTEMHQGLISEMTLDRPVERQIIFDEMVALRDRRYMEDVLIRYDRLQQLNVPIENYALMATGDAFLAQQMAEPARDRYLEVLRNDPGHHHAKISLFYAYIDLDEYDKAFAVIDPLTQKEPAWWQSEDGKITVANHKKLEADLTAARGRAYADNLAEAEQRFEQLLAKAPENHTVRNELATIYRWRGWPLKALAEYDVILIDQPDHSGARIGQASAKLATRRYRQTEQETVALLNEYPEDKAVQKQARALEVHNMREFSNSVRIGESDGAQIGTNDLRNDFYLFSAPYNFDYRFFIHDYHIQADLPEGKPVDNRLGVGVQYERPHLRLRAEVNKGIADNTDPGLALNGYWYPNDYMEFGGSVELNTPGVPLRGTQAGIKGDHLGASFVYRWHELQRIAFSGHYTDFDDGNVRNSASASLQRRLISWPKYKLTGTIDAYGSTNSATGVAYFNPESDFSLSGTLDNNWLLYRSADRQFNHRLALSLGHYWQENFDSNSTWSGMYEHLWKFSDVIDLRYGISRSRRVFDGTPEYENALHGNINWRF